MKLIKDFSRIALIAVFACSFALTSCKDDAEDNAADCVELAQKMTDAAKAYSEDPSSTEKCSAYRAALVEYMAGVEDCGGDGASLQTALDALPCE
ncbi:hypothetical protein Fleli_1118 [Bernardetia litoralis DSM 6794]|uniref:Lipoprotein n=1 Tax=Bernardetia litoralis (strain ATCC 23117 / DSM 6794 / NBRC 15988 / NCIMB 1366 / Fx l1 / Sio-4) TaxID=880071 RepID=I4AHX1_BERLS|nr:hypothetical protein [Bernardetia litoralis]AFM03556.1 hypothetical protein Fleli_1118 [Bernardetia litoralis DSM 6794]